MATTAIAAIVTFYHPATFEPDCSIGYLVRRIHQLVQPALEPVFAAEGITYTQWSALASIYFDRARSCAALARDLAYDKGAATRLVDTLEEKGWVTRHRNGEDRRVLDLALTDAGRAIAERCRTGVVRCWNEWLNDWDHGDIQALIGGLQRLRITLDAAEACCA